MPTFPSNPNTPPPNLGKPNPPIILRRDAGRTPGRRARHRGTRDLSRRAVRDPLRRGWRRGARDPGRDTGHTTQHHPHPAPTSTNTPHHSTPEKRAGKAPGNGWEGRGASLRGRGRGATGTLPSPPSFLYSPRKRTKAANKSKTLSGLVTAQKTTNPAPLSANAPQRRFSGALSTVVTVTVSTRPTSRPRRPYDRVTLSMRETSTTPFPTPFLLDILFASIKLLNNYSCSHLNYNKIAHILQAFYAITAGQNQNRTRRERQQRPDTPQYQQPRTQPETQTGAEKEEEGRGPKNGDDRNLGKSTQNHLTNLVKDSNVIDVGQGTSLPSTTKWAPSGCNRKGPKEGDTMAITEITAIIALIITVVMGLPEAILTIIKIRQELAKGKRSARRPRHRR